MAVWWGDGKDERLVDYLVFATEDAMVARMVFGRVVLLVVLKGEM